MSSDDDELFAEAWKWVWTQVVPWALVVGIVCFAIYSCGEILTAPRNYIYYGAPTS